MSRSWWRSGGGDSATQAIVVDWALRRFGDTCRAVSCDGWRAAGPVAGGARPSAVTIRIAVRLARRVRCTTPLAKVSLGRASAPWPHGSPSRAAAIARRRGRGCPFVELVPPELALDHARPHDGVAGRLQRAPAAERAQLERDRGRLLVRQRELEDELAGLEDQMAQIDERVTLLNRLAPSEPGEPAGAKAERDRPAPLTGEPAERQHRPARRCAAQRSATPPSACSPSARTSIGRSTTGAGASSFRPPGSRSPARTPGRLRSRTSRARRSSPSRSTLASTSSTARRWRGCSARSRRSKRS
jgi:hypothetical protein